MAHVTRRTGQSERIDDFLGYVIARWEALPDVAEEWADWDDESRIAFALDWPMCEDRLRQLGTYARHGQLTPSQRTRYDELVRVVARNRPIVERLLAA